jgi:hypothetical protein
MNDDKTESMYCMNCGTKMELRTHYGKCFFACSNPSCYEGRNFIISADKSAPSFCSCAGGTSQLIEEDLKNYRHFICPICRMKLIVAIGDKRIESHIEGIRHSEVSDVAANTLKALGVAENVIVGPNKVLEDLQVLKHTFENDTRFELLRLYEACKSPTSAQFKNRRKVIKQEVTELVKSLKKLAKSTDIKDIGNPNTEVGRLMEKRNALSEEMRSLYNKEYHGLEAEVTARIASQLQAIRSQYRIAKNAEFGNLSPDLIDPVFGLNAEVKVIDDRDDYWVAKGIKQSLSYAEIGRFYRAQFILVNFGSSRYQVTDELRKGKIGGRVDVVTINISNPPSKGLKPIVIDKGSLANFLDIGGLSSSGEPFSFVLNGPK